MTNIWGHGAEPGGRDVALVAFTLGVAWLAGGYLERRRTRPGAEVNVESLTKVAEALTKGVGLLTALIAVLATRGGGIGRLVSDGGPYPTTALVCVVASIPGAFTFLEKGSPVIEQLMQAIRHAAGARPRPTGQSGGGLSG